MYIVDGAKNEDFHICPSQLLYILLYADTLSSLSSGSCQQLLRPL